MGLPTNFERDTSIDRVIGILQVLVFDKLFNNESTLPSSGKDSPILCSTPRKKKTENNKTIMKTYAARGGVGEGDPPSRIIPVSIEDNRGSVTLTPTLTPTPTPNRPPIRRLFPYFIYPSMIYSSQTCDGYWGGFSGSAAVLLWEEFFCFSTRWA